MGARTFAQMNCSLAQTLDVIGDRWTLLILRDAFFGVSHFGDFQKRLGIARNILSTRLEHLVVEGVLTKVGGRSRRTTYELTEKGSDLVPILLAIAHWGDKYRPNPKGPRLIITDRHSGKPIQRMTIRAVEGHELKPGDLGMRRGPGLE